MLRQADDFPNNQAALIDDEDGEGEDGMLAKPASQVDEDEEGKEEDELDPGTYFGIVEESCMNPQSESHRLCSQRGTRKPGRRRG